MATSADTEGVFISSPGLRSKRYNREKYYSAIKTGFKHLGPTVTRMSFLQPPRKEEAMPALMPVFGQNVKLEEGQEKPKSSSLQIIFSCWNTMVGSAIVALPYAFQKSGIVLGILVSLFSFMISFYTCALIITTSKKDTDYVYTLKKYFGKAGWYTGLVGPTILIFGAITVYFVIIVQSLYPLLFILLNKTVLPDLVLVDPTKAPYSHFDEFSTTYVAIVVYFVLVAVSMKRDLSVFLKFGLFGSCCVTLMILFVCGYGIRGLMTTTYAWNLTRDHDEQGPQIVMFDTGFSSLAGILCAGYFIHQCSLPIIENAAHPEKNLRNVFIGYLLVFLCYVLVGSLGYIGFNSQHFHDLKGGVIEDNFLNMFDPDEIIAIVVRFMILCQLSCAYPLVNHFQRVLLMNLIFSDCSSIEDLSETRLRILNLGISIVPLGFCIFYPKIGTVLGYAASVSGFFMIYVVPVMAYMKMKKLEILFPNLAAALQENEVTCVILPGSKNTEQDMSSDDIKYASVSPKLVINDRFLARQQQGVAQFGGSKEKDDKIDSSLLATQNNDMSAKLRKWRLLYAVHLIIPIYGFAIMMSVLLS